MAIWARASGPGIDGATQRSDDAMADAGLAGSGQLASGRFQWRTAYQRCTGRECLPIGNGFSPAGCVVGEVATGRLEQVGARGVPVAFELRLRDCLRSRAASRDERTGILSWAPDQPAVRVSFSSRADRDNPQLVKAQGVGGIGLRMLDEHGRNVRLGSRGEPLWLTPGSNVLAYRVMAERTAQPLVPGSYHAVVDFHLSYD